MASLPRAQALWSPQSRSIVVPSGRIQNMLSATPV